MVQQIINLLVAHFGGAARVGAALIHNPTHTSFLEQIIGDQIQMCVYIYMCGRLY